ncbi:MAG TPA: wax ester/triacylglycerol synthase domain-containing protein, partial [Jatrophihabitantaceae bacterium]|nr:wax ester/triacylglycerol synthase domain-containing protein [Jatrophihabitantaceae bacterium]
MKQLSGLDTSFLSMETSTQFGHVNSLTMVDPSTMDGDVYTNLKRAIEERLHLLEVYRRKLATVPFDLDNPYWVDDPDLDLEYHV